jgi:hypothetical protein
MEEIITGVIARHRRTVMWAEWEEGKGKKVQQLINKQIIQNKTRGGGKSLSPALLHSKITLCRA